MNSKKYLWLKQEAGRNIDYSSGASSKKIVKRQIRKNNGSEAKKAKLKSQIARLNKIKNTKIFGDDE